MKKKTFGRIAALGLAGLTAVPVVSIAASADVSISKDAVEVTENGTKYNMNYAEGTAWKLSWKIMKVTEKYSYYNGEAQMSEMPTTTTTGKLGENVNGFDLELKEYYKNKAQVGTVDQSVISNYDSLNDTYDKDLKDFKDECADYYFFNKTDIKEGESRQIATGSLKGKTVYYIKPYVDGKPSTEGDVDFRTIDDSTQADGTTKKVTNSVTKYSSVPTEKTVIRYEYVGSDGKPAKKELTMSQLSSEFSGANYITIAADGKITAASAANTASDGTGPFILKKSNSSTTNNGTPNGIYSTPAEAIAAYNTADYSDASYYDGIYYWPNRNAMYYYWGSYPTTTIVRISSGYTLTSARCYFDYSNNTYSNSSVGRVYIRNLGTAYYYNESGVYKNSYTSLYYLSYSAAVNADSRGTVTREGSLNTTLPYFSMRTGGFYSTYAAAYSASGNVASYVIAVNGASSTTAGLDYLDPYYYYFMGNSNKTTSSDSSSVKIGNKTGWTAVASSAKSAKSGSTLSVSMNGETVIPSTVLSSIQGRNVTVNFTLKNGVVYTINGNDVSSAKDIDIDTIYNTKNVPSKLVSKAKSKNDGVSTSQLTIDSGSFGSSANVTVKFATKRAGCTARLYRYNSDRNSLSLVDKSTVNSSGKCTFDGVTKGGDYVIVLS